MSSTRSQRNVSNPETRRFRRLYKERLNEVGFSIYNWRLAKAVVKKLLDLTLHPKATIEKIARRMKSRGRGVRVA